MDFTEANGHLIQFGPFELDFKNAELRRKGVATPIQPAAFKLLEILASRPNELISREEIRKELWPQDKVSSIESLDLRLNFEIKAIREALKDNHVNPRYIQTVRKRGYKFIAPVEFRRKSNYTAESPEGNGQEVPRSDSVTESDYRKRHKKFPDKNILIAALIILGIGLGLLALKSRIAERPVITWVSPILPKPNQSIIIRGNGLGSYTNFRAIDSPFLAIRDNTAHWAAGRIMERNWDEVTLTVAHWWNSEILVTSFNGPYGQQGWKLNPGDKIEIAVWNPQTGVGPALYHLRVSAEAARR